jgi:outer membrane protein
VQRNNLKVTDLQFKEQVITTVTAVLNLYWDLVSFNQDLRARQEEVATAQQLLDNNQKQVQIGTVAEIEVTRAQSQLYAAKQDLLISQTNILQQETILKNALSRAGRRHLRSGRRAHRAARSDRDSGKRRRRPIVDLLVAKR